MNDSQRDFIHYLVLAYHVYCTIPRDKSLVLELLHHPLTVKLKSMYTFTNLNLGPDGKSESNQRPEGLSPEGLSPKTNSNNSLIIQPLVTDASYTDTDASYTEDYASLIIKNLFKQLAMRTHPDRCIGQEDNDTLFELISKFYKKQDLAGMIYCAFDNYIDVPINLQLVQDRLYLELRHVIHYIDNNIGPFVSSV